MTNDNASARGDKLSSLLDHYEESLERQTQRLKAAKSDRDQFIDDFLTAREAVIKPVLERMKTTLEARWHKASIDIENPGFDTHRRVEITPKISFQVSLKKGEMHGPISSGHASQRPSITFYCDATSKKIGCHTSTIGDGHGGMAGGAGGYTLEALNEGVVENEFVKWFGALIGQVTPR